ncbi:hypothetical protein OIDMADRAFT_45231 [Oidiodendron maius Zn]|uniref:FAD-binding domain-containing protein n=1 Tax=Oidiodendron maius (strain Zn) TaxID=913774 RepID=A0A0C3GGM2_OIDMZ|nr:hypothetical protein OIDMADRAFT_45231 [Oidiodendron maius Zn]
MTDSRKVEHFDVIICGCGPTGALLSANLSRLGVKHVVLEREEGITTDPRGIALDEDGIRIVQGIGKYEELFTDVGKVMGYFRFIGGGRGLNVKPFLQINYNTITGGTGHVGFMSHKQPALEMHLRNAIDKNFGEIREGCTVSSISEDDSFVYVEYQKKDNTLHRVRGKFLVGADGKTGFTRKKYLEPRGIILEKSPKFHYEAVWLGYSPEDVYDLFFPREFNFICDPSRPAVCGRFGRTEDRLWRFEFVVKKDEDPQQMATPEETRKIIFPYLKQPGRRFGLAQDLMWPIDCIECIRSRPFSFSARSCNRWSLGRVILCGDAAHVFPPFGGQGIASGFRDAISLSWRLKLAISPSFPNHDLLFRGWYMERKQQLERSLASTIENGNYCNEASKFKAFLRNWYLWLIQLVPSWRYDLELGPRKAGMTRYDYIPGAPFLPDYGGGISFPQVFAGPIDQPAPALPIFTDDAIFSKQKRGIFQVVALIDSLEQLQKATYVVHNQTHQNAEALLLSALPAGATNIVRVIGAKEYKAVGETTEAIASGFPRPQPLFYEPNRIYKELGKDVAFVIVRWDRIVFARCRNLAELKEALSKVEDVLGGK